MSKHFPVVLFNLSTGTEDAECINTIGDTTVLQMWDILLNNNRFSFMVAMELEGKYVYINCRLATNCFCYKQNKEKIFSHVVVVGMMMFR